jgi:Uma2 family endonuclease
MGITLNTYRFSIETFKFLSENGRLDPEKKYELIDGGIYKSPENWSFHARCVDFLSNMLAALLFRKYIVRTQSPVILNDFNQPQPDIAVLRYQDDFYKQSHPRSSDVLLVIEVSDTTVELDRNIKFPKYASANIPEAWLIDIPAERIEVHTDPKEKTYGRVKIYQRGEEISSDTMPEIKFAVDDILG